MKYSLHIGINYSTQTNNRKLYGCINDIKDTFTVLKNNFGYTEENAVFLCDESISIKNNTLQPTKKNILLEMEKIIAKGKENDNIFIQFSGHGSFKFSLFSFLCGYEDDFRDECLCTIDSKYITDNEMCQILKNLNKNCRCFILIDACYSGTYCDLPYTYDISNDRLKQNGFLLRDKHIIYISSSKDSQVSMDAKIKKKESNGVMTYKFLNLLKVIENNCTIKEFIENIFVEIVRSKYIQRPQISFCDLNNLSDKVIIWI